MDSTAASLCKDNNIPIIVFENIEEKMKKTVSVLKDELNTVRAGRANADTD